MEKTEIKFKHKKTLQQIILLFLGIVFLLTGFIGYPLTNNMLYFYFIALGNICILWMLFVLRVNQNEVVYDNVLIKYKLNEKIAKRIKADEIIEVNRVDDNLYVKLQNKPDHQINLENYSEESIDIFRDLLQQYT